MDMAEAAYIMHGVTDNYDFWYDYYDVESVVKDFPSVISELIINTDSADLADAINNAIEEIRQDYADQRRLKTYETYY